jgi:hypothetical protein
MEQLPKFYCVDCNYSWDASHKGNEPKGTMNFTGAVTAKKVFEVLTKGQDFSPEFRAALETQIVGIIFEQWFEGFKAGQMASILYAREHYGKDRNGSEGTTLPSDEGTGETGKQNPSSAKDGKEGRGRSGQRRRPEDVGVKEHYYPTVRKRISGIEFTHPRNIIVPENIERKVAMIVQDTPLPSNMHYDGKSLTTEWK